MKIRKLCYFTEKRSDLLTVMNSVPKWDLGSLEGNTHVYPCSCWIALSLARFMFVLSRAES